MSRWYRVRLAGATLSTLLVAAALLTWGVVGADPPLQHLLGMNEARATSLPHTSTIALTSAATFSPAVAAVAAGSGVRFTNALDSPVEVRTTALSPAQLVVPIGAHAQATVRLDRPGLYQYYDALTARPRRTVVGSTVLAALPGSGTPRQGWIAVLGSLPSLQGRLTIAAGHDLFRPMVQVALVGSTILVANQDSDAHNLVIDPSSPAGAAFIVSGTDAERPTGWQRALVVRQAGLYHVYCTLHARVVGVRDGWQVLVPRVHASGYDDDEPMEAWIIVLPATVGL